jgi:hypothetical protein
MFLSSRANSSQNLLYNSGRGSTNELIHSEDYLTTGSLLKGSQAHSLPASAGLPGSGRGMFKPAPPLSARSRRPGSRRKKTKTKKPKAIYVLTTKDMSVKWNSGILHEAQGGLGTAKPPLPPTATTLLNSQPSTSSLRSESKNNINSPTTSTTPSSKKNPKTTNRLMSLVTQTKKPSSPFTAYTEAMMEAEPTYRPSIRPNIVPQPSILGKIPSSSTPSTSSYDQYNISTASTSNLHQSMSSVLSPSVSQNTQPSTRSSLSNPSNSKTPRIREKNSIMSPPDASKTQRQMSMSHDSDLPSSSSYKPISPNSVGFVSKSGSAVLRDEWVERGPSRRDGLDIPGLELGKGSLTSGSFPFPGVPCEYFI